MNPTAPVKTATVDLGPVRPHVVQRSRRARQAQELRSQRKAKPWARDPRYLGQ